MELGILPSGALHRYPLVREDQSATTVGAIIDAFGHGVPAGLVALAAQNDARELTPSMMYWRNFGCHYLAERCQLTPTDPARPEPLAPPQVGQLESLLANAPPMRGAEYLSAAVLGVVWGELDDWVCAQIRRQGKFSEFLEQYAPRWHQVGRVCFHLAENKQDPNYPFAFLATYAPEQSSANGGKIRHQPLARALQEFAGKRHHKTLIRLLTPVQRAAETSALIAELTDSGDLYHPLAWTPAEAYQFLTEIPLYEQAGVIVRVPDWWQQKLRPQIRITIDSVGKKHLNADALLDFRMEVALDGKTLGKKELAALLAQQDGLSMINGQWVELDRQKLKQALAHWEKVAKTVEQDGLTFNQGMRLLAGAPLGRGPAVPLPDDQQWAFVQAGERLSAALEQLRSPDQIKGINPGSSLKATLRPYQKVGVNWLWLLSQLGLGACLADDMGLGKTMQVIAVLLALKQRRQKTRIQKTPSLLVLPASLLANWKSELQRFAPSLRSICVHPSQMSKPDIKALAEPSAAGLQGIDLVITTYGMLLRQSWLQQRQWQLLILDEAQAIKNPASRQTRAAKQLQAVSRIAMTGTPIENHLGDLWSLFDFLCPGLLGSAARFKTFVKSLASGKGDQYAPLRNLVSPYILRRLKTDKTIISDLPEKTEVNAWCGLSKTQAALYQRETRKLAEQLETHDGIKRRGLVLAYLMRFKQICNHPSQLLGDDGYDPSHSGKFARLAQLCEEIASRQEKMLVFTQFRAITGPLAQLLAKQFERPGLILHGGTPVKQRQRLVDEFQHPDGPPFFVLSLKAGGTGLNLTAASHVVHFDRWWNPAVENQATDRAFRIGQKKNVLVHKFVCQGTIEEKIDAMIADKATLADDILKGNAETLLTEMSNKELLALVSLDLERAQV